MGFPSTSTPLFSFSGVIMATHLHEDPKIAAAVERQVQSWDLLRQIEDRTAGQWRVDEAVTLRYVTISREAGAGGGEIARLLGDRLGWKVFDKNLLDQVAERFHESRLMLDLVDETPSNWAFDVLGHVDGSEPDYAPALHGARDAGSSNRWPARQRRVRGAGGPVPAARRADAGRADRGPGALADRADHASSKKLAAGEARQFIEETDRGRREFIERFFRHDIGDVRALRPRGQRRAFRTWRGRPR